MTQALVGLDRQGGLRVGVVGAGPWARLVHAPMWARHPDTELAGVWARRPEAAAELAAKHGAPAFDSFEALLEQCDAVSFAVPPNVQADLAVQAAQAGKALALDKPVALDVPSAERVAAAAEEAGVGTQILLTWRYAAAVREWLSELAAIAGGDAPLGGRGWFISGAFLGGMFATPWRLEHGALFDLGPHVIDLLDAALGTVVGIRAHGDSRRYVGVLLEHDSGAVSEVSMSGSVGADPSLSGIEVYFDRGASVLDIGSVSGPEALTTFASEFVRTAAGTPHPLGIARGLHLQRLIADAAAELAT